MYDKDKSKTIQLGEMVELFGTLYLNEGLEKEAAVERAMAIFSTLDINNDGEGQSLDRPPTKSTFEYSKCEIFILMSSTRNVKFS